MRSAATTHGMLPAEQPTIMLCIPRWEGENKAYDFSPIDPQAAMGKYKAELFSRSLFLRHGGYLSAMTPCVRMVSNLEDMS